MTQVPRRKRCVPLIINRCFWASAFTVCCHLSPPPKKKGQNTKTSPAQNRGTGTATGHIWTQYSLHALDPGNSKGRIVAGEKAQSNRNLTKDHKRNNISESWRSSKKKAETCWDIAITTITICFLLQEALRTESLKRPCSSDSCSNGCHCWDLWAFCTMSPLANYDFPPLIIGGTILFLSSEPSMSSHPGTWPRRATGSVIFGKSPGGCSNWEVLSYLLFVSQGSCLRIKCNSQDKHTINKRDMR